MASSRRRPGWSRLRLRQLGLLAVAFATAVGAVGCGSTLSGLNGTLGTGVFGAVQVLAGQPGTTTVWIVNHSGSRVILRSARLMSMRGYHLPDLAGVWLEPTPVIVGVGRGWPPRATSLGRVVVYQGAPVTRFAGFVLKPGETTRVLYGMVAKRLGHYAARGIVVTVSAARGQTATVDALGAGAICVVQTLRDTCAAFTEAFRPPGWA
jgi:hypothetical protein